MSKKPYKVHWVYKLLSGLLTVLIIVITAIGLTYTVKHSDAQCLHEHDDMQILLTSIRVGVYAVIRVAGILLWVAVIAFLVGTGLGAFDDEDCK